MELLNKQLIQISNEYKLLFGDMVTDNAIKEALDIDRLSYDEIYFLDTQKCINYHKKNKYIYIMAENSFGKIVGYINYSPITDEMYEFLKSGYEVDTVITADDILEYKADTEYSIYFSSICVHPKYRKKGISKLLLSGLDILNDALSAANITTKRIIADAVSESGKKLLLSRGFTVTCTTNHDSLIMEKKNG